MMSKPVLNGRAMSVSNWSQLQDNKQGKKNIANSHTRPSSNIGSQLTQINNNKEIYSIFQLNFPNLELNVDKQMLGQNLIENVSKIVKQIKKRHQKQIIQMEAQFRSLEMELKLVRDSRDQALQKYKVLQNQHSNLSQKVKSKELDCFARNEQIFQFKQKFQQMQKQLVVKNLQVKKIREEWSLYKKDTQYRIQHYQAENYDLRAKNNKIKRQSETNIQALERLQHNFKRQREINERQRQRLMKINIIEAHKIQNENREYSKNLQRDRSFSSITKSHNRSRIQRAKPTAQQLLEEVKELRENQSALLDRLAQRDKLIQNLENSLSNTLLQ